MHIEELTKAHTEALIENTKAVTTLTQAMAGTAIPEVDFDIVKTVVEKPAGADKGAATTKKAVKKAAKKVPAKAAETENEDMIKLNARLKILATKSGKQAALDLLEEFEVKKLTDLPEDQYEAFAERLTELREAPAEDVGEDLDLEEAAPEGEKVTYEQMRELLVKISNHDDLGKEIARDLIKDTGVSKMVDVPKESYAEVHKMATIQLREVGGL